jgi:transcriptional regulator GlxA family with amidase domain
LELDRTEPPLGLQHKERLEMLEVFQQIQLLVDQPPITKEGFDRICDLTHFTRAHFRRLFKEHTGFTPHSYFTLLRLNKATQLLGNTKLMLKEIAYLCGYDDEKYFNKLFRQKEGMSPQEYRSSILKM